MTSTARWQWLALALILGWLMYLLAPALTPFAIAALFAYLWDPIVDRLERFMPRGLAVTVVFTAVVLVLVLIVLLLIPFMGKQTENLMRQLPLWVSWLQDQAAPWAQQQFGITLDFADPQQLTEMLQSHWKEAGGIAASVIAKVSKSGLTLVGWVAQLVLIPVVTFYLMRDWDVLVARVHELLPRPVEPTVSKLARESDQVLGAFLRGQLSVMLALGAFYAIGLWLVGIDVGPLIGMIAGLISFVPYLGAIVGVSMGLIAALVQHHDWLHVLLVLAVFVIGQSIEGYVLVPKLVGDKIGLHPVAVIFAILAGGELFGFLGVLLALPAAAVAMVVLRYLHERYTRSELYKTPQDSSVADVALPEDPATGTQAGQAASLASESPPPATEKSSLPAD